MAGKCMVMAIASDLSCRSCVPHSGKNNYCYDHKFAEQLFSSVSKIGCLRVCMRKMYDYNFYVPLYMGSDSASNFHGPAHDLPETYANFLYL